MKRTTALKVVQNARERKGMTREQVAKKLKIGPAYLAGIENGSLAHSISPRVEEAIRKVLGNKALPSTLVETHNKKSKKYHAERKSASGKAKPQAEKKPASAKPTRRTASYSRSPRKIKPDPLQGLLPGFIEQVQPRVAEIAKDLVFKALQQALQKSLEDIAGTASTEKANGKKLA